MSIRNINRAAAPQVLIALAFMAGNLLPLARAFGTDERQLSFYHTHTRDTLQIGYSVCGEYREESHERIDEFLGDFRTGDKIVMDAELLELICDVRESLGSTGTYEVVSAYRSPRTNEMLRIRSNGVAKNSQHMFGKAIDLRLRGVDSRKLRDAAVALQRGGVGYYRDSDFVHMDTGRVRQW